MRYKAIIEDALGNNASESMQKTLTGCWQWLIEHEPQFKRYFNNGNQFKYWYSRYKPIFGANHVKAGNCSDISFKFRIERI